jgi:hypothetical protein
LKKIFLLLFVCLVLSIVGSLAQDNSELSLDNSQRLSFQHILIVSNLTTFPNEMIPGSTGTLNLNLNNVGNQPALDIRVKLVLPSEISFLNDVSEKRISQIKPDDSKNLFFQIVPMPKTSEGIYKASLIVDYLSSVGDERQDNYTIGIVVKSVPRIIAQVDKTDIYDKNRLGDITLSFTNIDVGDIKFLIAEIGNSKDFRVISDTKKYLGDLDSGDFQSTDFRIKISEKINQVNIPIKISYKDSLNKDYTENLNVPLNILTATELGIKPTNYYFWIFLIIVIIAGVMIYRKRIINKRKRIY